MTIDIEENAVFSYTGGNLGRAYGGNDGAIKFTVGKNAVTTLRLSGTRSSLYAGTLEVNEGASLYLWDSGTSTGGARRAVECKNIELNSPFQVVFATAGTSSGQLVNAGTNINFKATNIKSIRYFASGAGCFDASMNYIGINRNDYTRWWFQENGMFNVAASNWAAPVSINTAYNPAGNTMSGALSSLINTNFGAAGMHAIQIDGGSRAPIIDPIYVGAKVVTGTGVPGAYITVIWPTTHDGISLAGKSEFTTTTQVTSVGTWAVTVPDVTDDDFLYVSGNALTDKVKATQRETLYGLDRGESHTVYQDILGTQMKLVGHNSRSIYYNKGEIPDVAEIILYGAGTPVTLLPNDGRYIITNSHISKIDDAAAFETLWDATPSGLRGDIDPVYNKISSFEELCDIPANCKVWTMADITIDDKTVTVFDLLTYNNLYERVQISARMIEPNSPTDNIINDYTVIPGSYGIPYDLQHTVLIDASVRYNRVTVDLTDHMSPYWIATTKSGEPAPITITLDTQFPTGYLSESDDTAGLQYTLKIVKNIAAWKEVELKFVDEYGNEIGDHTGEPDHILVPMDLIDAPDDWDDEDDNEKQVWSDAQKRAYLSAIHGLTMPSGWDGSWPTIVDVSSSDFLLRGGRYVPLKHTPFTAVGYYVGTAPIDVLTEPIDPAYNLCANFNTDFNPEITNINASPSEMIFIVFTEGATDIREVHKDINGLDIYITGYSGPYKYPDRVSTAKIEADKPAVQYYAPRITGYVPVAYEINNLKSGSHPGGFIYAPVTGPANMDQNGHIYVDLTHSMISAGFSGAEEVLEIIWIYEVDSNNNGIPDKDEGHVLVSWLGVRPDGSITNLENINYYTRCGYNFGIGNDMATGDLDHKMVKEDISTGTWIFNKDKSGNDPYQNAQPVNPTDIIHINFYYFYSTDGEKPDVEQYIEVSITKWDDDAGTGATTPEFSGKIYAVKGSIAKFTPANIPDYVYYGYLDKATGTPVITYVNGQPNAEISFQMEDYAEEITLVYIKAGEPVTVIWMGTTTEGNNYMLAEKQLTGYLGETVTADIADFIPNVFWLRVDGQDNTKDFTLGGTAQEHTFFYTENTNYVPITITGMSSTTQFYSYEKRVLKADMPFMLIAGIDVFTIPDYMLDDHQNFEVVEGKTDYIFYYTSKEGTVKITLKDQATNAILNSFTVEATAGYPFTYRAPNWNGYRFVTADGGLTESNIGYIASVAADGSSEIVFEYAKITSRVTVLLKENDTNGVIIKIEEIPESTLAPTGNSYNPPTTLPGYYTLIPPTAPNTYPIVFNWDGNAKLEFEVYYTKDTVDLEVKAVDKVTREVLHSESLGPVRKGEIVRVTAPTVTDYTLVDDSIKQVEAIDNPTTVTFEYLGKDMTTVTVNVYVGDKTGAIIHSYEIAAMPGVEISVNPSKISVEGYSRIVGHVDERLSVIAGDGDDIRVIMRDDRLTVTVKTDVDGTVSVLSADKFAAGAVLTLYPPYVNGYVPVSYSVDAGAPVLIGGSFAGYSVTVSADLAITWKYPTIDEVSGRVIAD